LTIAKTTSAAPQIAEVVATDVHAARAVMAKTPMMMGIVGMGGCS
jgi:hypothetical protein